MVTKKTKKMLALMLAGTMTMGMGITAHAEATGDATSGDATGSGELEGHVDRDVLRVTLPTTVDASTFKYIIDPEGLIAETDNAKYADATFEEGANVFFQSADKTYTKDSKKLKVTNKGTVNADVTVTAQAVTSGDVKVVATSGDAVSGDAKNVYLGLNVAGQPEKAVETTAATVTVGVLGKSDNFETTYNETTKKYEYAVKQNVPETAWNSFEFGLVNGVCNENAKWTEEDASDVPTVKVTWEYEERVASSSATLLDENAKADAAPSIAVKEYNYDRTKTFDITADFGAGDSAAKAVKSVKIGADGKTFGTDLTSACVISGNKITFPSGKLTTAAVGSEKYIQVTFDEGTAEVLTLTVTK